MKGKKNKECRTKSKTDFIQYLEKESEELIMNLENLLNQKIFAF